MTSKLATLLIALGVGSAAQASTIYTYVDWTSDTLSNGGTNGSASGTLTLGVQTITVTYSGDVVSPTQIDNTGTDYYTDWQSVYTNSMVANSPTNVDLIALSQGAAYTDTLTFSSPLLNPILDLVSMGSRGSHISYIFDATLVILSQGSAFWGGCATCLSVGGNTLTGAEGDGVVEFAGSFSSISWTTTGSDFWNGLTVGIAGLGTSETPEPATWLSFLTGGVLLVPLAWRRRKRA